MLPKFVKVFPHEYKRVSGIARSERAVQQACYPDSHATPEVARG